MVGIKLELKQLLLIINYYLDNIVNGRTVLGNFKYIISKKVDMEGFVWSLIYYFKIYSYGFKIKSDEIHSCIGSLKGEFGVYLILNNLNKS